MDVEGEFLLETETLDFDDDFPLVDRVGIGGGGEKFVEGEFGAEGEDGVDAVVVDSGGDSPLPRVGDSAVFAGAAGFLL